MAALLLPTIPKISHCPPKGVRRPRSSAGGPDTPHVNFARRGSCDQPGSRTKETELDTVRGRIGYSLGQTLVYFTGGFAYGNKNNEFDDLTTGNVYKDSGIHTGYVLGGGLEYKLTPSWSLKAEYQYIELGRGNATDSLGGYVDARHRVEYGPGRY